MSERLDWPYVLRAWGIIAVYYGHLAGSFWLFGSKAGHLQMKFLATFVVAGFFMLAGYFYRDRGLSWPAYLERQWKVRLAPVVFFQVLGFLMVPVALLAVGKLSSEIMWSMTKRAAAIVVGWPMFAGVAWFLVCLFTVELFHQLLRPLTRSTLALVASIVGFVLLTWLLPFDVHSEQQRFHWQSWFFFTPALASLPFYQLGVLVRRHDLLPALPKPATWALSLGLLAVLLTIYDRNQGPFPESKLDMPLLGFSAFGHLGWFFATGLVGCVFLFLASRLFRAGAVTRWLGENSLLLMCLNSLPMILLNRQAAGWAHRSLGVDTWWEITLFSAVVSVLLFLVMVPIVALINRRAPWIAGREGEPYPRESAPPVAAEPMLSQG